MKLQIALAAGAVALFSVLAPVAQAAPGEAELADSSCPKEYFCFWAYNNYQGPRGIVRDDNPDFRKFPQSTCSSGTWDNCINSIKNNGKYCTVYMYAGYNYSGKRHSLGLGDGVPNISGWVSDGFEHNISSNKWCNP
ncbi:peptidase inhibitor family I36 protein [Nocardia sp. NPDC050175]|uniref:peptidase inhibitor family I36 protein n=1 Tax=Nocardia sp. NPDC050175 TaxID=3364317 RepID=UPI0037A08F0E